MPGGGQRDDLSHAQAAVGVAGSGLGMRRAARVALPAFLCSRVESRWLVQTLAGAIAELLALEPLLTAFDTETLAAQAAFEAQLSPCGAS